MKTKIIEATNSDSGGFNWGKFMVGRFDHEWGHRAAVVSGGHGLPLLTSQGWSRDHILVLDLATGEGAIFKIGGLASADLNKHRVWVCPMFEPFLEWLYKQDLSDLAALPAAVQIDNPASSL